MLLLNNNEHHFWGGRYISTPSWKNLIILRPKSLQILCVFSKKWCFKNHCLTTQEYLFSVTHQKKCTPNNVLLWKKKDIFVICLLFRFDSDCIREASRYSIHFGVAHRSRKRTRVFFTYFWASLEGPFNANRTLSYIHTFVFSLVSLFWPSIVMK